MVIDVRKGEIYMSKFKEKCRNALAGGAAGSGNIGTAIGVLGGPVTSAWGTGGGGAIGRIFGFAADL